MVTLEKTKLCQSLTKSVCSQLPHFAVSGRETLTLSRVDTLTPADLSAVLPNQGSL